MSCSPDTQPPTTALSAQDDAGGGAAGASPQSSPVGGKGEGGHAGSRSGQDAAGYVEAAAGGGPAAGTQIVVEAGDSNRDHTIVSFALPGSEGKSLVLRDAKGISIPLQVAQDGTATFILPTLGSGQQATYSVEEPTGQPVPGITALEEAKDVKLLIGSSTVLRFQMQGELPQGVAPVYLRGGYIHPLYTPGGGIVTDDYPPSHIHHHGIWSAWVSSQFNGHAVDFWNMATGQGKVDFDALSKTWSGPVHAGFSARLLHVDLVGAQPATALREQWVVTAYKTHDTAPPYFVFELVSTQEAATNMPLLLNNYLYGAFGMRGHGQWLDPAKVTYLTSEGLDRVRGDNTKGRWCYIGGAVDGKTVGYATLGHPSNFRAPQTLRLHPQEPYLSFAPVKDGPFSIQPGTPYVSRFRVISFDGPPDKDLIDRIWRDYATPPKVTVQPAP